MIYSGLRNVAEMRTSHKVRRDELNGDGARWRGDDGGEGDRGLCMRVVVVVVVVCVADGVKGGAERVSVRPKTYRFVDVRMRVAACSGCHLYGKGPVAFRLSEPLGNV